MEFHAVPEPVETETGAAPGPTNWNTLFEVAGLSMAAFTPAVPRWVPLAYSNERKAWDGRLPERPEVPIRVEAAAFAGRPVFFTVTGSVGSIVARTAGRDVALHRVDRTDFRLRHAGIDAGRRDPGSPAGPFETRRSPRRVSCGLDHLRDFRRRLDAGHEPRAGVRHRIEPDLRRHRQGVCSTGRCSGSPTSDSSRTSAAPLPTA